jgi:hypothetical protein
MLGTPPACRILTPIQASLGEVIGLGPADPNVLEQVVGQTLEQSAPPLKFD